jgi:DNA repair exonuclease SbcCD nuclease subunit
MKIAILGDTHIGARNDSTHFHSFFKNFYDNTFFPYLEENKITHIIQLGDVFDRRKYINFQSLKSGKEYLFERLNKDYQTHVIVGNHDTFYKNTNEVNSLQLLLGEYKNIHVVNSPTEVMYEDFKFLLMPWICQDNEEQCLKSLKSTDAEVVAGHFEIAGFEMYRGSVCDHGVKTDIFNNLKMVLSGHFHHRSQNGNIHYLGTPYEMTWSDYDDQKGFHIFDTDTKELTFIPNPHTIFHKFQYDDAEQTLEDFSDHGYEQYKDQMIKIIVRNKTNPAWFDLVVDKLEKAGAIDIQVVDDHFHLDLEDDADIVNEAEDTLTILNKYVDQLQMQGDRQRLDTLIRTLYHDAMSVE